MLNYHSCFSSGTAEMVPPLCGAKLRFMASAEAPMVFRPLNLLLDPPIGRQSMRFFVRIPELDSSLYESMKPGLREELLFILYVLKKSGRMVEGGLMADERGGFLLMEAESWLEQENFLNALFDSHHFHVESHPVLELDEVKELLDKEKTESHKEKAAQPRQKPKAVKIPSPVF
jgi:hypothetical protein